MRKVQRAMAIIFLGFICALPVAGWLTPDRKFSPEENRMLEPKPKLSLYGVTSGKFTVGYENYVSDQFPIRDFWIGVNSDTGRALGKKESNGVYLGKDGYLIQQFQPPAKVRVEEDAKAIRALAAAIPNLHTYVMLAPTSLSINKEKLPDFAPVGDELASLKQMRDALGKAIKFVDVYPALFANRQEYLYYRTDHHWTTLGAYYAYRELCKQMGINPQAKTEFELRQVTDQFYGSLYSRSGFKHIRPDEIELWLPKDKEPISVEYTDEQHSSDSLYVMENLKEKDKYAIFLNGNHAQARITSDQAKGRKLLVVKDSYANSLIPFLTKHFSEIVIVDLRYYDDDLAALIRAQNIQDLLLLYNINTFVMDRSIQKVAEMME